MNHGNGGQENKARAGRRCREALSKQLGLIRRDQALAAGLSERRIETLLDRGEWTRLSSGVYASSSGAPSWRRSVLAAIFRAGPDAVASGRCAAALLSLPGFRPGKIEITSSRQLKNVTFITRRGTVPADQATRIGPIPTTDPSRTLLDLASDVPDATLEDAFDDALRRSLTSIPRLKWLLRCSGNGKRGSPRLRKLIQEREDGGPIPESVLETRLWKPLSQLGVPHPIRQYEVECDGERYRIDFAFPHAMVAVEAQGYRWHSSPQALERDAQKHNALVIHGWNVIYLTWKDVKQGRDETMGPLRDLLLPRFL